MAKVFSTKKLFGDITKKPWFDDYYISPRKFIVCFNRLRVNHNLCKAYLNKINIEPNDKCEICMEREDMEHIIMTCKKYIDSRKKLFKSLTNICTNPFSYKTIIQDTKTYGHISKFLRENNINV